MSTIPTQNPVPSEAPKDLKFNSGKIDEFVTSNNHFYTDRFGKNHYTIDGINYLSKQAMLNYGYITKRSFESGNTIINPNDVLLWESNGEYYRWDGDLPKVVSADSTPESAGGIGEGKWKSVGDATLRSELSSTTGSSMIGDVNFNNLNVLSSIVSNKYYNHGDIFDVFVVYGQSNAVGYAQDTNGFPDVIDGAMFFDYKDNQIKKITKALPYSSGNVSTGHAWATFANEYIRKTGRKVLIIPCAKGESSIVELSKPLTPSNTVYDKMISSFNSAMIVANRDGISIGYKSILFHQGETDMTLGTKKQEYQNKLDQLIRDMRSDMGLDKCFLYRVGCPQNRKEMSWYAMQTAQDYLCQSYDWMVMAYSGCGTFTIGNGLLREGVHYTQNGYNVMGHESASVIVDSLFNKNPSSEFETEMYGTPLLPQDQIWRYTYGRLLVGSDGNLTLLDKSNTGYSYRTINISRIEMLEDKVRLYLQSRANWILGLDVEMNEGGKVFGVQCFPTIVSVGNNEFAIDLSFLMDVSFAVSKDGDLMRAPDLSSSSIPPFVSENITIDKSNGIKITHGGITGFPVLFGVGGGSVSISNISSNSFMISSSSGALITLNRMKVKPTSLPRSMQIALKAIICEKKE
ncbi:TPA: sialate O-acetylesterase [Proteus mirabilis]